MKIKTINWITLVVILFQFLPGMAIFISPEIERELITQSFGKEITNEDALLITRTFFMVLPFIGLGLASIIVGLNSIKDQETARKLCKNLAIFMALFAAPDVINTFTALIAQPLPLIVINYACVGLLIYGSQKGTV